MTFGNIKKANNTILSPHFKKGDKVIYNDEHEATVLEVGHPVRDDNDHLGALVEWDNKNLAPPTMGVPYRYLKHALKDGINANTHCPVCKSSWKETVGERNIWHDCLKCGKTKEEILEEIRAKDT